MERLEGKTIGVLLGGISPEKEVSRKTGQAVLDAIRRRGLTGVAIEVDQRVVETMARVKIDVAFIALHGTFGEDGAVQGILECARIPYTGAGVLGSALAFDKVVSKMIFQQLEIPTPDFRLYCKNGGMPGGAPLALPVVVKPTNQGSSIGVTIVREQKDFQPALATAFSYSDEAIVEQYIDGKLLAVGMNGDKPLPIVHIVPKSGFYDYEAKYTPGKTDYICPATLGDEAVRRCQDVSRRVFQALRGRGFPRVDIILSADNTPYVLEMNTIPGMTATSLLPMAARKAGMEFDDLVVEILRQARLDNP